MRCLGIDYGERRIGLAYGDDLGVATPLPALDGQDRSDGFRRLATLVSDRRITDLVVGYPLNMDGSVGFKAREVEIFIKELEARIGLPVHQVDERLTTEAVRSKLPKGRDDALRRSGRIDSMAAALILQDFLDQQLPAEDLVPFTDES
jgi:putative Holliday junction resolvase